MVCDVMPAVDGMVVGPQKQCEEDVLCMANNLNWKVSKSEDQYQTSEDRLR
jgi:hypothetical protein